jgi:putative ABC transport system permease protein
VATGLGFGLAPALLSTRGSLADALKDGARGSGGRGGRLRQALVIVEIALAMVLLAGAGLLTRSFAELSRVRLGFDPQGVVAGTVQFSDGVEAAARKRFFSEVLRRLGETPGVEVAGMATSLPMDGGMWGKYASAVGRPPARLEDTPLVRYQLVGGEHMRALRLSAARGRLLGPEDDVAREPRAVINETAARTLFGGADPVGQRIMMAPPPALLPEEVRARLPPEVFEAVTVVGVVRDVRSRGPGLPPAAEVFRPHAQSSDTPSGAALLVRGRGDLAAALRGAVAATSAEQPIADVQPLTALLGENLAAARFHSALLGAFAALALLLALVGVHGVMSYTMSQRAHEMGIRLALGATPRGIVGLVLRRGLAWLAIGLTLGVAGAAAAARLAASLLFGVSSGDPAVYLGAVGAVLVTALAALLAPAWRASRVSPLTALRDG